ncbi:hypothetical protein ACQ4PT_071403 [Festuca glaucescens]
MSKRGMAIAEPGEIDDDDAAIEQYKKAFKKPLRSVWNVRGLNDPARRLRIRAVIQSNSVSLVCVSESKLGSVTSSLVMEAFGACFSEFVFVPAAGTRGGLICAWNPDVLTVINSTVNSNWIAVDCVAVSSGENFRVISVYGPQLEPDKLQFLTDLEPMLLSSSPCCLMGDFNLIVSAAEKSSNNLNRRTMAAFRRFINKGELQELYLHGRRFTWSNEQADAIMVKLDRALHNAEWNSAFPNCLLQALSSDVSDHCPLLFTSQAGFKPCRRFRFENSWVKLDGFHEQVLASWNAPLFCYDAFERLRIKFARTAKGLAKWSGKLIGNLQLRALISSDLIQRLDEAMDCRRLTTDESQFRSFLKMNLLGISALQRSFWRQRSRVQWIREGDANTNFFHLKASARRRKNHITHVMHDGIPVAYQQAKLDIFQTFFEDLLGTNHPRSAALNFSELGVEQLDLQEMDSPFSEDEVKAAIFELHPSKAPGPDGYTACFYRHCWGIIKSDVMEAFKQFEMMACNKLHLLNEATLILIPKKPDASEPKDFRPISLVCSFSKLLLKVLARRLQPRMAELVRPCQSAFVRGRTIHDNFTYIRGLARIFTQKKIPALFLKLDLQKAFDSISWPFLIEVLRAKGFSDKFCNWICWMLASARPASPVRCSTSARPRPARPATLLSSAPAPPTSARPRAAVPRFGCGSASLPFYPAPAAKKTPRASSAVMPPKPAQHANRSGSKKRDNTMSSGYRPSKSPSSRRIDCRCSPHLLSAIMKLIVENDEQKGYVGEIGFGSFLSMGEFEMNKALTLWLVDKFNCDSEALEFDGGISIPVRPLVKSVLGIPSGPIQVVERLDVDDALYSEYTCNSRAKNVKEVANEMCCITDKEPFCIAFMMTILGIYLAPNTSGAVNRALLGAVKKVDKLKEMDWCNFVATYLFEEIKEFKESNTTSVTIKGCVHILSVIFIDFVKDAAFEIPVGFPRLGVVTTKHMKWVVSHPFTSLLVRRPEESVYAAVLDSMPKDNIVKDGKCVDSETNTDALSDKSATSNTDQNNNKNPISVELGTAITSPGTTSWAIVEHVDLGTSPRSAVPGSFSEHISFPTSGEQLQSSRPCSEPCSAQVC